ncbi:T6SS effector amidase Tae4 family protein [Vibrio sp. WXL103]|uniref:T6SS effector amidase Tae4 family protein n=1 Tax=Vibrio sp. WXL103 TaxID=3450710 RepID=UPI003EC52FBA
MIKPTKLWESYPTIQGGEAPCKVNGKKKFNDQCATRLRVALASYGVKTTNLVPKGRLRWYHNSFQGHELAVEKLANGLARVPIGGIQKKAQVVPVTFNKDISGKKGIIFFKDFWAGNGESFRNLSGVHIDLWSGSRLTDWRTWPLISSTFNKGRNYSKSKGIWFWRGL